MELLFVLHIVVSWNVNISWGYDSHGHTDISEVAFTLQYLYVKVIKRLCEIHVAGIEFLLHPHKGGKLLILSKSMCKKCKNSLFS